MNDFIAYLVEPYKTYETYQIILEVIAATLGIASVFYSMRRNILVYPTGIISTALYVYILFVFGLYGDCLINVYYTSMSVYGWILWSKSTEDNVHIKATRATKKEWIYAGILFILSLILVIVVYYYKPFIENNFPREGVDLGLYHLDWANWIDVFTTSIFLIGMWLMAKQRIENWIFWILADLIVIPMFIYKGLVITSLQYVVFTILAFKGYAEWRKNLQYQEGILEKTG